MPTKDEIRWIQDETRLKEALKDIDYSVEILFSQGTSAKEKENVEALIPDMKVYENILLGHEIKNGNHR